MSERVLVVGAGIGGLVAALLLAARGLDVQIIERAEAPGGKMREVLADGVPIDAGPTVFTMRWVFEEILDAVGETLSAHVTLHRADILARHAWTDGSRLDLYADPERSAEAIAAFAGPRDARAFERFRQEARLAYEASEHAFIRAPRASLPAMIAGAGLRGLPGLRHLRPFESLWGALGRTFADLRLRQLFGRYATYCGSSPFEAPATLMLIAHVEQEGVWLVEGGMHRLARALADLAEGRGARIRYGVEAREIAVARGRATGVVTAEGERIEADAVVLNADAAALADGLFGPAPARAVRRANPAQRSLSAVTWAFRGRAEGFPLARHNVLFSSDYAAEFDDLFARGRVPGEPTVYVCAQDRGEERSAGRGTPDGERFLCLVNAPPLGDRRAFDPREIERCETSLRDVLARCGLSLTPREAPVVTTPAGFERLFPGTGGALYGRASHGWRASFARPGGRTRLPGLYLAGGSVHPGAGVPMAALSGRTAAALLLQDLASTGRWRQTATPGGTSTRSATTGLTASR